MKDAFLYRLLRPFFVIYIRLFYRVSITYLDKNLSKDGCILVGNHTNYLDFICMGLVTKRNIHFLAKNTLFKGILKPILEFSGIISVDRSKKDKTVIPKCIKLLDENKIIGIFPEGTFNKTNNVLGPFKMGSVKMSLISGKPIIPVAIIYFKKYRKIKIIVGKEYYIKSNDLVLENKKLMKILEKMILEHRSVLYEINR